MPSIRLFVDAHSFDKEHQGTRAFIKRLYSELATALPEVKFFFGTRHPARLANEFTAIRNCKFIRYRSSSSLIRLLIETPWIIYRHKIDLAHFQYILPFIKNCRCIVTTHDILFRDFPADFPLIYRITRNHLFRRSLMKAEIRTTVSEYSRDAIAKHYGIEKQKILLTPSGVSHEFFDEYNSAVSRELLTNKYGIGKYALYVSRFEPRKNHAMLLQAYLDLQLYKQKISLVMLGHKSIATPEFQQILQRLDEEQSRHIFISDSVNDEELFHFYRGASVFVYPSRSEGFGLPPIEAAALRVPVICSNSTAMADYAFFGENHITPDNRELLASRLSENLKNPPPAERLAKISAHIRDTYQFRNSALALAREISALFQGESVQ